MKHFTPPMSMARPRGMIGSVRADVDNPQVIFGQLRTTIETFMAENDERLKGIDKKFDDVVQSEKVDRINAEITALQTALNEVNIGIAAMNVGGLGGVNIDPAVAEHAQAFNTWFRRGDQAVENTLQALQVNAALTTQSDPDGGYLVTEEMSNEVDRILGTVSAMRGMASSMQLSGAVYKKLVNTGGTGSGWVGEEAARPTTATPALKEVVFNMMELYANPGATQGTLDDARLDVAAWLGNEVAVEFAEQEGAAFITGNGVNKPRGILGYSSVENASYAWGSIGHKVSGVAAALSDGSNNGADAAISLFHSLKSGYRAGAEWLMADSTIEAVRKFKDSNGAYLFAAPSAASEMETLMRKPIRTDDNMPAVGADAYPIAFGNFKRGYLIVDRFGIRVLRDPFTNKPYVHFYTTKRVGGGVQNFEAIKLMKVSA